MEKFKELSVEEVTKLSPEDQIKYFNNLNHHKADQINAMKIQLKTGNTEEIKKQIEELRDGMRDDNLEQMKSLQKALETQGLALNKLLENGKVPSQKRIEDYLYELKDAIANAKDKTVTIKTDVTTGSLSDSPFALDLAGVGQLPTIPSKMLPCFATGSIGDGQGGVIQYIDQATVTRSADWVAEAGVKPESAITWVTKTLPLETVADTIPVTNQTLSNIPFIASEIRNFLLKNLALKVDASLWNGSGVAPIIFGIYTRADEYVAVASGITDANIYDLINKMKVDITSVSDYVPNKVLMNPNDVADYMQLKKDGNNNYLLPPFVEMRGSDMYVSGMLVVESSRVVVDTMCLGDFTYAVVYNHGGVSLDIGLIDKQFVENMVTLRAEQEMALLVRDVHTDAFRKETGIAAGLVTLATAPA